MPRFIVVIEIHSMGRLITSANFEMPDIDADGLRSAMNEVTEWAVNDLTEATEPRTLIEGCVATVAGIYRVE